jgi:fructose PTS system EIIBC or EIIC component
MKLLAVIEYPTGIAHTDLAAEALEQNAADAGHEIAVGSQGPAGTIPFTDEQLLEADAVILAVDAEVQDEWRLVHLPTVRGSMRQAISDAEGLVAQGAAAAQEHPKGSVDGGHPQRSPQKSAQMSPPKSRPATAVFDGMRTGAKLRVWLITGVSYVIPFVAAGGLLIAIGCALGGYQINQAPPVTGHFDFTAKAGWAALLFQLGGLAFQLLVPVLGGFTAHAIAGRTGLVPGFVGGAVAVETGAGFFGGLVAGLVAGAVTYQLMRWRPPRAIAGTMPVLILPLIGTLITGAFMWLVVGTPLASATIGITNWLGGLSGGNAVLLGAVVGLMMAFDLGGPVNKAVYTFAIAGLSTGSEGAPIIMAAVMSAGMTPPLAMALATVVRKRLFSDAERANGRAAWLLGASFVTEGAIPFAATDPLRVIPSLMAGSAVTGALSITFGSSVRVPHGGIFVLALIANPLGYLVAILAGILVSTAIVIGLKSVRRTEAAAGT